MSIPTTIRTSGSVSEQLSNRANLVGTKTVDDSMAEFALGQCAMIQNGDWAWNTIANTDGRVVEDENVVFIPISCGVEGEEIWA